jgi:tRNA(Arg) A34 adenosine deaminase TadA
MNSQRVSDDIKITTVAVMRPRFRKAIGVLIMSAAVVSVACRPAGETAKPKAAGEPPIAESRPRLDGNCALSVEFDPCADAWFHVPDRRASKANRFLLTPEAITERDRIFSLAALAVAYEDWQPSVNEARRDPKTAALLRRGHNVGSVLVDERGRLVWWERNSNTIECNGTNHAETRLMLSYGKFARRPSLGCHTVYTSLEPCAMCAGMMAIQRVARVVYVQRDPGFGGAVERLHAALPSRRFECGLPRVPISRHENRIAAAARLDAALQESGGAAAAHPEGMVEFLTSRRAREIFEDAGRELLSLQPMPVNEEALRDAKALIADLRSPIYSRSYATMDQHVAIERMRRAGKADATKPRLGMPLEVDPCCRPVTLAGVRAEPAVSPMCRVESPVR